MAKTLIQLRDESPARLENALIDEIVAASPLLEILPFIDAPTGMYQPPVHCSNDTCIYAGGTYYRQPRPVSVPPGTNCWQPFCDPVQQFSGRARTSRFEAKTSVKSLGDVRERHDRRMYRTLGEAYMARMMGSGLVDNGRGGWPPLIDRLQGPHFKSYFSFESLDPGESNKRFNWGMLDRLLDLTPNADMFLMSPATYAQIRRCDPRGSALQCGREATYRRVPFRFYSRAGSCFSNDVTRYGGTIMALRVNATDGLCGVMTGEPDVLDFGLQEDLYYSTVATWNATFTLLAGDAASVVTGVQW